MEYEVRKDFFAQLQRLPLSYLNRSNIGDLVSRGTNDLSAVFLFFGPGLFHFLNTIFVYCLALGFMLAIDPLLTLYTLLPYPVLALATRAYGQVVYPGFHQVQERLAAISSKAQENLSGIRVVKAYVQEESEIASFSEKCWQYVEQNLKVARVSALFHAIFGAVAGTSLVIVLWFGGRAVISGRITLGGLIAFSGYLAILLFPTIALGWIISLNQRAKAALKRLNEVMEWKDREEEGVNPHATLSSTDIEFRNLSFAYPGTNGQAGAERMILKDITLKVPEGATLGVAGPTGSGKSTLVSLIAKLYPVAPGQLFIGGQDIVHIPGNLLRRQIGFVPQDPFLFSESLKENIAYGASRADDEAIFQAADLARLSKDLNQFPDNLDSLVGERGITLSGGQRQRAALARALMVEPKILIIDEAAGSLDAETEEEIRANLVSFIEGRTCIIVSHRMTALKDADHIIVLDGGRMVEQGSHKELLKKAGLYARMYRHQLLKEELERY